MTKLGEPSGSNFKLVRALCIASALLTTTSFAVGQTPKNRCTLSGGVVVYLSRACPVTGTVGEEMARKEYEFNKRKQEQETTALQGNQEAAARLELCAGKPVSEDPKVGMTEHQFLNCTTLGIYRVWERVNETETAFGFHRQYVVNRGTIKYVYTNNGIVTSIQR